MLFLYLLHIMFRVLFNINIFALDGGKTISLSEYNKLLDKFKTLNTRTQQLELNEYKRNNNNWNTDLFNISTAYEIIDDMFKIKPDLTWNEIIETGNEFKQVCINTSLHWVENSTCSNGACFSKKSLKPYCSFKINLTDTNIKGYAECK